jgi:N-acetylglucosaminyl-diphospho-decaprenol L-rhamnosyltransferase
MLASTSEHSARHASEAEAVVKLADGASLLVVIVNYKTGPLVADSLRALASEVAARPGLCPTIRVAVVDNDSRDGSADVIEDAIRREGYSEWAVCVRSTLNGGYAYGNNLAVRAALRAPRPPEYFLLLNPDTQVRPGALSALVAFVAPRSKVGIAGSGLLGPDGSAWRTAFRFPTVWSELELGVRLGVVSKLLGKYVVAREMSATPETVDWLPGASILVRKSVFDSIGLMDEGYFLYYEETDFCLQAARAGWERWYVPQSQVMHIAGQSTGVTARDRPRSRLPAYVLESRRRYFTKNHGLAYAALADSLWSAGFASWRVRRVLQGKPDPDPPHLLVDSLRHSVLGSLLGRNKKT